MTTINPEDSSPRIDQQPGNDRKIDPVVLERARELFEVDEIENSHPTTMMGLIYLNVLAESKTVLEIDQEEAPTEADLIGQAVDRAYKLLEIIEDASPSGRDVIANRFDADAVLDNVVVSSNHAGSVYREKMAEFTKKEQDRTDGKADAVPLIEIYKDYQKVRAYENFHHQYIDATTLVHMLSGSKDIARGVAFESRSQRTFDMKRGIMSTVETDSEFSDLRAKLDRTVNYLTESAARNPSSMRRSTLRQIEAIKSGVFDSLLPPKETSDEVAETSPVELPDVDVELEFLQGQELNFQVLPSDTNLRELSEDIFRESTDAEKVRVDLERVKILEDIRQLFGSDKCYFARGIPSGVTYANEKNERINEDFIVLVMQNHDATGSVMSEDALAISPIARRHAAFYMRQDASEGLSWREVFGLKKGDAKDLGARKLKFIGPEDMSPYDAMREKIFTLAAARPEDFADELRFDANSKQYFLRKARLRSGMTTAATSAAA